VSRLKRGFKKRCKRLCSSSRSGPVGVWQLMHSPISVECVVTACVHLQLVADRPVGKHSELPQSYHENTRVNGRTLRCEKTNNKNRARRLNHVRDFHLCFCGKANISLRSVSYRNLSHFQAGALVQTRLSWLTTWDQTKSEAQCWRTFCLFNVRAPDRPRVCDITEDSLANNTVRHARGAQERFFQK